jgi:hypothetical protein
MFPNPAESLRVDVPKKERIRARDVRAAFAPIGSRTRGDASEGASSHVTVQPLRRSAFSVYGVTTTFVADERVYLPDSEPV